jgi:uncharacterized protein YggU (UPF0235/DUF167 family)
VNGAANEALSGLIAAALGVPSSRVRLVSGATNRRKILEVEGLDAAALRAHWPGLDV